jgi:hypothetical protein
MPFIIVKFLRVEIRGKQVYRIHHRSIMNLDDQIVFTGAITFDPSGQRALQYAVTKAALRHAFSVCVYCMQFHFQSNYFGLSQTT